MSKGKFSKDFKPFKTVDGKNVEKLFAIVQTGSYNDIKSFISNNNITFDINDKGKNLIHIILNNTNNFEEEEIYELVKYFIDHSVSITSYDTNNVTPLHLAAKKQYYSVIKLLIENGAKINATTNQYMTPLHYAAQGNIVECKPRKIIGSLISINDKSTEFTDIDLKNLTVVIIDIFYDELFRKFSTHIKNSINNIEHFMILEFYKMNLLQKLSIQCNQILIITKK